MRTLLITGNTRGIGYHIARRFSSAYQIIGCGSNPQLVARLREEHPSWDTQVRDLSRPEEVKAFGRYVLERYEDVDILVNNVGAFEQSNLLDEPDQTYERMLRLNLDSAYYLTKAIAPIMIKRRAGLIVQMASVASLKAYPQGGSYGIAKAALLAFSRNLREVLKPHGVAVTTFLLGPTWTDSWTGTPYPEERFIRAESVAELLWTIAHLPPGSVVEEVLMRPILGDI